MRRANGAMLATCARLVAVLLAVWSLVGCKVPDLGGLSLPGLVLTSADDYRSELRSSKAQAVSDDATKRAGILTVGLRASEASPLLVEVDGKADGLDVDVACVLADELGLRVEFVRVTDVGRALESSCDVVMGVSPLEATGFDVVGSYAQTGTALFGQARQSVPATAEEVRSARIAVQTESSSQQVLTRLSLESGEVVCDSLLDAFDALAAGGADFVACNLVAGRYVSILRDGIALAGTLELATQVGIGIASSGELSGALAESYLRIENNGVLAAAIKPWLGSEGNVGEEMQVEGISAPTEEEGAEADGQDEDDTAEGDASDVASDEQDGEEQADGSTQTPDAPTDGASTESEVVAGSNAATL